MCDDPRHGGARHAAGRRKQESTDQDAHTDSLAILALLDEARAGLALRVAWLTVTGHQMFEVDDSGQLSAQLWDLRDLLVALDREGRWDDHVRARCSR